LAGEDKVGAWGVASEAEAVGDRGEGEVTAALAETAFVCLLRLVRPEALAEPTPEEEAAIEAHYVRLKEETERGRVLLAGPCVDGAFGVLIFRAASLAEARAFVEADPVVLGSVMTAEMHPFRISLLALR
jgi:uncharacterized protein YciI